MTCLKRYMIAGLVRQGTRAALSLKHWSDENLARIWKSFGPIIAKGDPSVVPLVVGQADGVVVDVG
jgi:hypothetical protein